MRIIGFNAEKQKGADKKTEKRDSWEDMAAKAALDKKQQEMQKDLIARQDRKVIAAFLLADGNGHINKDALGEQDVDIADDVRAAAIDMMARGQITDEQKREVVMALPDIFHAVTSEADVNAVLTNEQDVQILTDIVPDKGSSLDALKELVKKCPTPAEFEDLAEGYLISLDEEKLNQVLPQIGKFEAAVYGKRYEYHQRIKSLEKEAFKRGEQIEKERSKEWAPGSNGMMQFSREQIRHRSFEGMADESCEDALFVDTKKQLYGIFDGSSAGNKSGRRAAYTAREALSHFNDQYVFNDCGSLAACMGVASDMMRGDSETGQATGAIAKVVEIGNHKPFLAYSAVGDAHIYIVDRNGKTREITKADGASMGGSRQTELQPQLDQVVLNKGDCVVMCTKSIASKQLSTERLGQIVYNSHGPEDATENLMSEAITRGVDDDCTVTVFVPKSNNF